MKKIAFASFLASLFIAVVMLAACKPDAPKDCVHQCLAKQNCEFQFEPGKAYNGIDNRCLTIQTQCVAQCPPMQSSSATNAQNPNMAADANKSLEKFRNMAATTSGTAVSVKKPPAYGAIAFDKKSSAWGISDEFPDEKRTKVSALYYCDQNGPDCQIVASFSNSCATIATGDPKVVVWKTGHDQQAVQTEALTECTAKGGTSCSLRITHCYGAN